MGSAICRISMRLSVWALMGHVPGHHSVTCTVANTSLQPLQPQPRPPVPQWNRRHPCHQEQREQRQRPPVHQPHQQRAQLQQPALPPQQTTGQQWKATGPRSEPSHLGRSISTAIQLWLHSGWSSQFSSTERARGTRRYSEARLHRQSRYLTGMGAPCVFKSCIVSSCCDFQVIFKFSKICPPWYCRPNSVP